MSAFYRISFISEEMLVWYRASLLVARHLLREFLATLYLQGSIVLQAKVLFPSQGFDVFRVPKFQ